MWYNYPDCSFNVVQCYWMFFSVQQFPLTSRSVDLMFILSLACALWITFVLPKTMHFICIVLAFAMRRLRWYCVMLNICFCLNCCIDAINVLFLWREKLNIRSENCQFFHFLSYYCNSYDTLHHEAEKKNQFFMCISFNTWQKLVNFFIYIVFAKKRLPVIFLITLSKISRF